MSDKKVRYPAGGKLTLHTRFGDTYPVLCPNGGCTDYDHNLTLSRQAILSKPWIGGREQQLKARTVFLIDADENGSNGLVWSRENNVDGDITEFDRGGTHQTAITIPSDKQLPVIVGGKVSLNMQTSTTSDSRWGLVAIAKIENAYVTQAK